MSGCCKTRVVLWLLVVSVAAAVEAHLPTTVSGRAARPMTLEEARPVIAALGDIAPPVLRGAAADAETRWSVWVKQRDAHIRARVVQGDEDSVVNLMLYGTGFTRWPRATPDAIAAPGDVAPLDRVMDGRVNDLVISVESPGDDERLTFVREVFKRRGIDVGTGGRDARRRYLVELRSRVFGENERYMRRLAVRTEVSPEPATSTAPAKADGAKLPGKETERATLYRDRGLSSDTSLRVGFAVEQALVALRDRGELRRPVEHVAVIGPGLDFLDKAQGYDFYPVQTIQPFALADSLRRLGLAQRPRVTALDISPRIVAHLRTARQRAERREPYRLNVLLQQGASGPRLDPALVEYWRHFGEQLGTGGPVDVPVVYADQVRARGVDLRPEAVLDVDGAELNIVLERLTSVEASNRFDVVVATNVLVYYDPFEQALALSNMASMLRDEGLLVTNQPVPVPAACRLSAVLIASVSFDRVQSDAGWHERGESIYVYRKSGS